MKIKRTTTTLTLFFLLAFSGTSLLAQLDTAFWFAAPEVSISNQNFDRPIMLRFTSSTLASVITVTQPANPLFVPISLTLAANSSGSVNLTTWIDNIENKPPNQVLNYGLKVTATNPVSAYYEVVSAQCLCNPEIFALKGKNALGTEFYIPIQNFMDNNSSYTPAAYSSFDIVATENNTQVVIIPSINLVGHTANIPYIIYLNRGQTYSATAASQLASQHPGGSKVVSDKPIAITVKDDLLTGLAYGTCADLAGDQIVPVDVIGDEYIVVRGFLNTPYDKVFIMATQSGTGVSINGTLAATLSGGQTYQYSMGTADAAYITSTAPVYVWHLSGFGCEVGLSILPPIKCTGSSSVSFTRSNTQALYVTLLVPSGGEGNFLFNGNTGIINAASFSSVPSTGGLWKYAKILFSTTQIPSGSATRISNSSHLFHLGIIHGTATDGCRYGYFSDYAKFRFEISANKDTLCTGDSLAMTLNNITGSNPLWSGPNSFNSTNQSVVLNPVGTVSTGFFHVSGSVNNCIIEPDSLYIHVHPLPLPTISTLPSPPVICLGDSITLTAHGGNSYTWSGGLGTGSTHTISPSFSSTYTVHVTDSNGCEADTSIIVQIQPWPGLSFQPSAPNICQGDSIMITVSGAQSYLWNGGLGSGSTISVSPGTTTTYTVQGWDSSGCNGLDSVVITVHPIPIISLNPSSQSICLGDTVTITASGAIVYEWNPGNISTNPLIVNPGQTTTYTVSANDANGCFGSDSIVVSVHPNPVLILQSDKDTICSGDTVTMDVVSDIPGTLFMWSTGHSGSPVSINPVSTITVTVTGTANGCSGTQNASIFVIPEQKVSLGKDDFICANQTNLLKPSGLFTEVLWWDGTNIPEKLITDPGVYWVKAFDGQCFAHDTIEFFECPALYVPNAFTPDGDGRNDRFFPVSIEVDLIQMDIFNKFGQVVFSTSDPKSGWNGLFEGQLCPEGVYVYLITYYNPRFGITHELSGTVHLIR